MMSGEDYSIVGRMLCPECRGKLEVIMQELVTNSLDEKEQERIGASEKADILHIRCQNCGHEFKLISIQLSISRELQRGQLRI